MIEVNDLSVGYEKGKSIIEHMSFSVEKGEIFGFLGPSGAGKSTLQKVLIGMLKGYSGSARVDGRECNQYSRETYERIGVDFEYSTMYEKLTARENLAFFSSLYKKKPRDLESLLDQVGLLSDVDKPVGAYSKGMKARVNFVKAIMHSPELICLDEPTSGLDPTNNRMMKQMILQEKKRGATILLTTHNMQDATELCDRVAFIVNGKIVALDSPHNLIMKQGASRITYSWQENGEQTGSCLLEKSAEDLQLQRLILQNKIISIHSSEPTLNDIFVSVTGRSLVEL